ncbi:MAG: response regulator [Cyanobacteriota bacterium]|nr:response regulator [Cyanobacteriota bacterium]
MKPSPSPVILVVEDDPVSQRLARELLMRDGYQVVTANNGEEGIQQFQQHQPQVVLLDAVMPTMDGLTCCRQLRQLPTQIPILMVTGVEEETFIQSAFAAGATDYISKPIQWSVLRQRLRHLIQVSQAITLLQHQHHQEQQQARLLEQQVEIRTQALNRALTLEATLKRITDKVRDSLDESQILQTAVQELALSLNCLSCDASFFDLENGLSTVMYEYIQPGIPSALGKVFHFVNYWEIYQVIQRGESVPFCSLADPQKIRSAHQPFAVLACPLQDERGPFGDLWLYKNPEEAFEGMELRLVQQVANQCGIAIRQARLYQAAQQQIMALQDLNRLKDEFLSTVSHELRTPLTTLQLALHLMDKAPSEAKRQQYYRMAVAHCDQEIALINDLLDLQRLGAASYPLYQAAIDLIPWLIDLAEPYVLRASQQNQEFLLELPVHLTKLPTDPDCLGRILRELLNNACKYTPAGGSICLQTQSLSIGVEFAISNTGGIPQADLPYLFERFYRGSHTNHAQVHGTGLGLALVKELVELLQGTIAVSSAGEETIFRVWIPPFPSPQPAGEIK